MAAQAGQDPRDLKDFVKDWTELMRSPNFAATVPAEHRYSVMMSIMRKDLEEAGVNLDD